MCFWASCASARPQSSLRPKNEKKATGYYSLMTKARFGRRTFYEPSLIRIKADLNSLDMLSWFRRRSWFQLNLSQKEKNIHFGQTFYTIVYDNLCIWFRIWKGRRLNQNRSKVDPKSAGLGGKRTAEARSKLKQALLINSDAELFMYLIQCIKFGPWEVRPKDFEERYYGNQQTKVGLLLFSSGDDLQYSNAEEGSIGQHLWRSLQHQPYINNQCVINFRGESLSTFSIRIT